MLLFSHQVLSDPLLPHGLQHARLPCPSLSPGVCSNSCPLSQWCYLIISSSATLFSFPLNLAQHQGLFQWVRSSHQLSKVLELQFQHQSFQWIFRVWFHLGWTSWISLQSKGLSRVFSSTTFWKHKFFSAQPSLWSNFHILKFLGGSDSKESSHKVGDLGLTPGLGRSPGEGNGSPL